ncbi:MAG: HesA/MoeB/ThiF family protein, partial [Porphyromonadaceae bacterium]|nr:HesA/MoeB/ThiF family protein [Porphyromonadaceae bacterium]
MDTTEIDNLKTRYARQMSLPEVGEEGQMRLIEKRVAIIGAGGLGSALLPLLVGAGVGHLTLCDDDSISVSNLPRQTLYTTHEVGRSKAQCAAERLRAANPHCDITAYSERLTEANATRLIGEVELLIDATDNEATRLLLDHYASEHHIPWLYASLEGWCGQLALFLPDSPSRYRDLFPEGDKGDAPSPT